MTIRIILHVLLLAVAGAVVAMAQAPIQMIPLGKVEGRIDHMCLSDDGGRLFIAALGNNSVEVVDIQRGGTSASIGKIGEPQGVAYIPDLKRLVVASGGDGECRFYDDALRPAGQLGRLDDADNVRYDPAAKLLYVGYGDAMAIIDPAKPATLAHIKLPGHPESFQLESKGPRIFINVPSARKVVVVDRDKRAVIANWSLHDAGSNFPMAIDEPNRRVFVGCRSPARLLVLDSDSGKLISSLPCCGDTDDLFHDAATKRIYASGGGDDGSISVFEQSDPDHYRLADTIRTAPGARTCLFDPAHRRLYIAAPDRDGREARILVFEVGG